MIEIGRSLACALVLAAVVGACERSSPSAGGPRGGGAEPAASERATGAALVPAERDAKVALGLMYQSGAGLYAALKTLAGLGLAMALALILHRGPRSAAFEEKPKGKGEGRRLGSSPD